MKHYYFNPKTQDIHIFDTESKELLVLERIIGVRVLTTSDIESAGDDEPVKHWKNSVWDPKSGVARDPGERKKRIAKKAMKRGGGRTITCKKCGEQGHFAKTCTKADTQSEPLDTV